MRNNGIVWFVMHDGPFSYICAEFKRYRACEAVFAPELKRMKHPRFHVEDKINRLQQHVLEVMK